jgi:nucleoside-diphosphate-sugar epimerase
LRVLVTGNAGHIGKWLTKALREAGYELKTLDRTAAHRGDEWEHIPGDLRDMDAVRKAVQGVDAVAHLGAIASDRRGSGDDVLSVNVQGTWNVLLACVEAGVSRVVYFSSINALGCVGGHRPALYLPIDDAYPRHPMSPYQLSKHLGEEICRSFTNKHGIVTVCLRPGFVAGPDQYRWFREAPPQRGPEWGKVEYWAYVDIRDVVEATLLSLKAEKILHDAFLLMADDTTTTTPTAELIEKHYPDTPWKQDRAAWLADNPYRTLMDCTHAKEVLGWQPKHSWREETASP